METEISVASRAFVGHGVHVVNQRGQSPVGASKSLLLLYPFHFWQSIDAHENLLATSKRVSVPLICAGNVDCCDAAVNERMEKRWILHTSRASSVVVPVGNLAAPSSQCVVLLLYELVRAVTCGAVTGGGFLTCRDLVNSGAPDPAPTALQGQRTGDVDAAPDGGRTAPFTAPVYERGART